jgi:hypothetical protein
MLQLHLSPTVSGMLWSSSVRRICVLFSTGPGQSITVSPHHIEAGPSGRQPSRTRLLRGLPHLHRPSLVTSGLSLLSGIVQGRTMVLGRPTIYRFWPCRLQAHLPWVADALSLVPQKGKGRRLPSRMPPFLGTQHLARSLLASNAHVNLRSCHLVALARAGVSSPHRQP